MYMKKVGVARFRSSLGRYLRAARQGRGVVITDRDRPIARLVPWDAPPSGGFIRTVKPRQRGAPPLGRVKVRSVRVPGVDSLALLMEDRANR
jgi:prevent-host-death family protein